MKKLLPLFFLFSTFQVCAQCDETTVFDNDSTNAVCFFIDGKVRTVYTNNFPNHPVGTWPSNNPIDPQDLTFYMCAFPQKTDQLTSIYDAGDIMGCSQYLEFGLGTNGIRLSPFGARWFVNPNTQEENRDWNVEPLEMFQMDFNNSHSNGGGQYHYHGIPINYFTDSLAIDGTTHSPLVGYAADGFPIYYKYAYTDANNPNSGISAFSSGHTLKTGNRLGDGITAPDGAYDGFYIEDYEFTDPDGPLDECNGRFGVTPEYPEGTYYYLMTDNWPFIPRCFYGSVIDNTFRIGPNCPSSNAEMDCSDAVVNTNEVINTLNVLIRPNPASTVLQIDDFDPSLRSAITQISIYDTSGRTWLAIKSFTEHIDIAHLPNGSYFLQINFSNTQITRKIIVQQ
ncbi:MAG: YHYH protein [Bacteroidota bacterium]